MTLHMKDIAVFFTNKYGIVASLIVGIADKTIEPIKKRIKKTKRQPAELLDE